MKQLMILSLVLSLSVPALARPSSQRPVGRNPVYHAPAVKHRPTPAPRHTSSRDSGGWIGPVLVGTVLGAIIVSSVNKTLQ